MQETDQFIGEQLIWGNLGNALIATGSAGAVLAILAYYFHLKNQASGVISWKSLGKIGFGIHGISVLGIVGIIFYLLLSHRFEYHYVWNHSNKLMEPRYVFASFWEGQEGSFLLWTFWNVVIGTILMFTAKKWESGVMMVFGIVQLWLLSMIWGIHIPGLENIKLGSNPFILTREHPNFAGAPFTQMLDYLERLDGKGLNPALQNYWMTIHPPTLFFGFALTLVPFSYALAGLKTGDLKGWIQPVLPWVFACVGILGLGILMGGAWAYEALNFGGFWAWDPVENTSIMPWLMMVAGGHLLLIQKSRGTNLFAGILLIVAAFVFTLFSTFCTRSGILGEASVHAFTDLGMGVQLELFLFFFMWLPGYFFIREKQLKMTFLILSASLLAAGFIFEFALGITIAYTLFFIGGLAMVFWLYKKYEPRKKTAANEDSIYSREFWMFIGSMVLVISTLHLVMETSKPIFNKIFETEFGVGEIEDFNRFQGAFAILITLFMAFSQFLRYRNTDKKTFFKIIARSALTSALIIIAGVIFIPVFRNPVYIILAFTSLFTILGNADYILRYVKTKWRLAGASIAHIGFGLIIFGSVISAGHKQFISSNAKKLSLEILNPDFKNNENIMLHRGDTLEMGKYFISYVGDSISGINVYFKIDYFQKDKSGNLAKVFSLYPRVQVNATMGNVAEPSTLHKWNKDIFTHVVYVDKEKLNPEQVEGFGDFKAPIDEMMVEGETIVTEFAFIQLKSLTVLGNKDSIDPNNLNTSIQASFEVRDFKGDTLYINPVLHIRDNRIEPEPDFNEQTGLKITFHKLHPGIGGDPSRVEISIQEKKNNEQNDYIIMQAIIFPGINILWCGCIIMVIGSLMAVWARIKKRT